MPDPVSATSRSDPASTAATGLAKTASRPGAIRVRQLGRVAYGEALRLQERLVEERRSGVIGDQLLLVEHPHVITLGTAADPEHVLLETSERRLLGVELFETGRGGDATYHGPGQLVGYPILDLKPDRRDLHAYLRSLEEVIIRAVAGFGISAQRRPGHSGVWVGNDKIAAIGVRVSSGWITSHGFALNVSTDLRYFDAIVPCGIRDGGVTSIEKSSGRPADPDAVGDAVAHCFREVFRYEGTPHRTSLPRRQPERLASAGCQPHHGIRVRESDQ